MNRIRDKIVSVIVLTVQAAFLAVLMHVSVFAALPTLTIRSPEGVTFPESVVDLNASFTLDGVTVENGILPLLSKTLIELGFGDFSTLAQVNGILQVTGTGSSEGIELFLMPPLETNIKIVNTNTPGYTVENDGSYPAIPAQKIK